MSKPVVKFSEVLEPPYIGHRAVVRVSGSHHTLTDEALAVYDGIVTTSTVVDVFPDGSFETRNTLYEQA